MVTWSILGCCQKLPVSLCKASRSSLSSSSSRLCHRVGFRKILPACQALAKDSYRWEALLTFANKYSLCHKL